MDKLVALNNSAACCMRQAVSQGIGGCAKLLAPAPTKMRWAETTIAGDLIHRIAVSRNHVAKIGQFEQLIGYGIITCLRLLGL